MKKQIPLPFAIGTIVVLIAVVGFFLAQARAKGIENAGPPVVTTQAPKIIQRLIWDGLSPERQAQLRAEGFSPGEKRSGAKQVPSMGSAGP